MQTLHAAEQTLHEVAELLLHCCEKSLDFEQSSLCYSERHHRTKLCHLLQHHGCVTKQCYVAVPSSDSASIQPHSNQVQQVWVSFPATASVDLKIDLCPNCSMSPSLSSASAPFNSRLFTRVPYRLMSEAVKNCHCRDYHALWLCDRSWATYPLF